MGFQFISRTNNNNEKIEKVYTTMLWDLVLSKLYIERIVILLFAKISINILILHKSSDKVTYNNMKITEHALLKLKSQCFSRCCLFFVLDEYSESINVDK